MRETVDIDTIPICDMTRLVICEFRRNGRKVGQGCFLEQGPDFDNDDTVSRIFIDDTLEKDFINALLSAKRKLNKMR